MRRGIGDNVSPGPLFDICANRHKRNPRSTEARLKTDAEGDRERVLAFIAGQQVGATCYECEVALGMRHQTASARFSELKRSKEIKIRRNFGIPMKRPTDTGCLADVFVLA